MKHTRTLTAFIAAFVLALAVASDAGAALIANYGRLLTSSYTTTSAIDSDDLDCPPTATLITAYVYATTNGTVQAYYVPLGGEAAVALDSAVAYTSASGLWPISYARPTRRLRFRFTPSSSTGSVWIDAFCGGPAR